MTGILFRLVQITAGYVLACIAGITTLFYAAPETGLFTPPPLSTTIELLSRAATIIGLVVDAPVVLAAGLALAAAIAGELLRLRSWLYHLISWGGAAGASVLASGWLWEPGAPAGVGGSILLAFIAAGFIAGLVYWLVAGRSA